MAIRGNVEVKGYAYWAKVLRPDKKNKYTIDLVVDDENAAILEAAGASRALTDRKEFKEYADHPGKVFVFKRAVKEGKEPPTVIDTHLRPVTDDIGNGSFVYIDGYTYDWTFEGKVGVSCGFNTVMVLNHVPYDNLNIDKLRAIASEFGVSDADESAPSALADDNDEELI